MIIDLEDDESTTNLSLKIRANRDGILIRRDGREAWIDWDQLSPEATPDGELGEMHTYRVPAVRPSQWRKQ